LTIIICKIPDETASFLKSITGLEPNVLIEKYLVIASEVLPDVIKKIENMRREEENA